VPKGRPVPAFLRPSSACRSTKLRSAKKNPSQPKLTPSALKSSRWIRRSRLSFGPSSQGLPRSHWPAPSSANARIIQLNQLLTLPASTMCRGQSSKPLRPFSAQVAVSYRGNRPTDDRTRCQCRTQQENPPATQIIGQLDVTSKSNTAGIKAIIYGALGGRLAQGKQDNFAGNVSIVGVASNCARKHRVLSLPSRPKADTSPG